MRSKDYRRHQKDRIHQKWQKIGLSWGIGRDWGFPFGFDQAKLDLWVNQWSECMPTCSRPWCCGNPRGLGHRTWQERRAEVSEREQVLEYEETRKQDSP